MSVVAIKTISTPVGDLFLAAKEDGAVVRVSFLAETPEDALIAELTEKGFDLRREDGPLEELERQLEAYFRKEIEQFTLPLEPDGTEFQRQVWDQLIQIPYGTCQSYGDIAQALGNPGASRAVGLANNKNPIPIIIPCHRVIGSRGKLVGFGGGIDTKHALLVHEGYYLI